MHVPYKPPDPSGRTNTSDSERGRPKGDALRRERLATRILASHGRYKGGRPPIAVSVVPLNSHRDRAIVTYADGDQRGFELCAPFIDGDRLRFEL